MQSQERAIAPWSLGQRTSTQREVDVHAALARGTILRTHVLRPTWHYVHSADVRWLLKLTAPRVHVANAHPYRRLELGAAVLTRSNAILARALEGGRHLTRAELAAALKRSRISTKGQRLPYLMMYAELEQVICSGAPRGKQHTYALFDERVPASSAVSADEALAALTMRFFRSRGAATVQDFSLWSGLTLTQARQGLAMAGTKLDPLTIGPRTYWIAEQSFAASGSPPAAHLLQGYDEYFMSYRESRNADAVHKLEATGLQHSATFLHGAILDGQFVGHWRRIVERRQMTIEVQLRRRLTTRQCAALDDAARRYGVFVGLPVSTVYR